MYQEADYLQINGLQHLSFCPRQCALIHMEQYWKENYLTAGGQVDHEKVHSGLLESRKRVKTARSLRIASSTLGLIGQTDAVEFYKDGTILPIEYKHGEPQNNTSNEVQLCAQVICLEEMLHTTIEQGALFYFKIRKRILVPMTAELRAETIALAHEFHRLIDSGITPEACYKPHCKACSLLEECFPKSAGAKKSVSSYLEKTTKQLETEFA